MVVYAVITEKSVGKLLIAGIIPGILAAVSSAGHLCPRPPEAGACSGRQRRLFVGRALPVALRVYGIIILFALVVGGIYGGYFPATYAGAVGAFGAF